MGLRRDGQRAGVIDTSFGMLLDACNRMIGLGLVGLAIDGCISAAPCGREVANCT